MLKMSGRKNRVRVSTPKRRLLKRQDYGLAEVCKLEEKGNKVAHDETTGLPSMGR